MNGRVYDPLRGRMLSPDAFVQNPSGTQAFNRYSYVMNNPLKYTDPSSWLFSYSVSGVSNWNEFAYINARADANMSYEIFGALGQEGGQGWGGGTTWWGNEAGGMLDKAGAPTADTYEYWVNSGLKAAGAPVSTAGKWREAKVKYTEIVLTEEQLADIRSNIQGGSLNASGSKAITAVWGLSGEYLGERVKNFLGIVGLTCKDFYWYSKKDGSGWGGLYIDLSFTSKESKTGYRWIQKYSQNGGPEVYDNEYTDYYGTKYSGSIEYYSPEELANHIHGNTITFYDAPRSPNNNDSFRFELSLYNGSDRVFSIYYGYDNVNGITTPYYPKAIYP